MQENVRGEDVFVLQSTSYPANDHLMELLIMMDAFMRSSARRITAVIPYFGYARQDRRASGRTPISAKLVANMITRAGADRVLTLDLHAGQIQGFFDIPTDNLFSVPVMARDVKAKYKQLPTSWWFRPMSAAWCAPARWPSASTRQLAIVDKRRERPGESEVMNVIGDVGGKDCLLIDDIVDSGGTLCNAADALLAKGASSVTAYITHGVLSGGAIGPHHRLQAPGTGDHRFHPADAGVVDAPQHPRRLDRRPDRRGDFAHRDRGIGVEPVRLTAGRLSRVKSHSRQGPSRQPPPTPSTAIMLA